MKLNIVIPAFRDERVLETIESIQGSELEGINLRVIVQVGESGEEYEKLISQNFPWVEIGSEKDGGIFNAINIGLKKCDGDLILTLGSDDRVSNKSCFQIVKEQFFAGYECISTDMQYTDLNWKPVRYWSAVNITSLNYFLGYQHAHFALFLSPKIYRDLNYFNEANTVNADYEFFWHLTTYLKKNNVNSNKVKIACIQMKYGGNSSKSIIKIIGHQVLIIKFVFKNAPQLLPAVILFKWFHKIIQILKIIR
jgi:glycosyltransferase involved in cell wall biosynthesis